MSATLVAALLVCAPEVRYAVKVVTKAWEPIAIAEVEPVVEAKVLAPLAKGGAMKLAKSGYADLAGGDYALTADGRFIEEAGTFSIYVGFRRGRRDDLPSFHVSESAQLAGSRGEMVARIEAASERAGRRMAELVGPRLEAVRLRVAPPPVEEPVLPWAWGEIDVPPIAPAERTKAIEQLLDVSRPDHERQQALSAIEAHVFDQQAARNAVERCVLSDPTPGVRARCVEALAPVARAHVPTQRILLHAMRTDVDEGVLGAIGELSKGFVGLSRKESIATWLELVVSEATPPGAARKAADLLREEDDVPNLEIAVAACLAQEALIHGKKQPCADLLLPKVAEERRLAVAWRYLDGVRASGLRGPAVFEDVVENVAGRSSKQIAPELAEMLLRIAESPVAGRARRQVMYPLRRHPAPSADTAERMIALVPVPELAIDVLRTLAEWGSDHPELKKAIAGALGRLRGDVQYLPRPHHENPHEAIAETISRLSR